MANKYGIVESDVDRVENAFTYHIPIGDQVMRYALLRGQCKALAYLVLGNCPASRERSLALTAIEEVCMWANAAIARNEFRVEEDVAPLRPRAYECLPDMVCRKCGQRHVSPVGETGGGSDAAAS